LNKTKVILFAGVAIAVAIGLVFAIRQNSTPATTNVQGTIATRTADMTEINPFTNVASIPSTVDPSSIRFEKLRTVELATKTQTKDVQNCKDRQSRDGDMTCQTTQVLEKVKAIELRYSYDGPVISSGEAAPGRDQFSVYFKPEDLASAGVIEKLNREQAASLFDVNTSRQMVDEKVIDKEHSRFCEGNYVDGNWTKKDANCQDQVQYKTVTVPSPNLLVQVDIHHPSAGTN
jgi:hypothetical protein